MRRATAGLVTGAAAAALLTTGAASSGASASPENLRAIGLTAQGELIRFDTGAPRDARAAQRVTGLQLDTRLVGIDYRIQDGRLYGVGEAGGIYRLTARGAATQVSQLTVPLDGTAFGVDFNPAADRLRIVSDTGQNLRHDINPGGTTIADTTLSYPPATAAATGVSAAAYTNNDLGASTATTLFDVDTVLDQVAVQAPANSGQLSVTGKLGLDAVGRAGLDVYSARDESGTAVSNRAFATLKAAGGRYRLYSVSLLTGEATRLGAFPARTAVTDVAVRINQ
jgi:hypothetical protein